MSFDREIAYRGSQDWQTTTIYKYHTTTTDPFWPSCTWDYEGNRTVSTSDGMPKWYDPRAPEQAAAHTSCDSRSPRRARTSSIRPGRSVLRKALPKGARRSDGSPAVAVAPLV